MSPYDPISRKYPLLAEPLGLEQFASELELLLAAGGIEDAHVEFLDALDSEHRLNPRRYAQVRVGTSPVFQFSRAILWLPDEQRIGVLAHEVGHVLAPTGGEDDADDAAFEHLGISIYYDSRWPGKGLQTAYI